MLRTTTLTTSEIYKSSLTMLKLPLLFQKNHLTDYFRVESNNTTQSWLLANSLVSALMALSETHADGSEFLMHTLSMMK